MLAYLPSRAGISTGPLDSPLLSTLPPTAPDPGLHTAGAQRALPLDRGRKRRAQGKRLLGEGLALTKVQCEGTLLCFHLRITSYLSLNSPRVFFLGLRPQECSKVQEGWDQALNCRPPH